MSIKSLICALLIGSLAACAGTPSGPSAPASVANAKLVAQKKAVPPGCVASTGTHLQRTSGDCPGSGSAWTQEDLKRTGSMDAGQGLSQLDPSVTTTSH